jgi:hypothetical protein
MEIWMIVQTTYIPEWFDSLEAGAPFAQQDSNLALV